jgi:hypothetical protein
LVGDAGKMIAARHVSENLGIEFDKLKALMTGDNPKSLGQLMTGDNPKSLGQAIQELNAGGTS